MKRNRRGLALLMAILAWVSPGLGLGADGDAIVGIWNTMDNDARVEIYRCGSEYRGRISYLEEAIYPADDDLGMAGLPKVDRHNPDPALRHRPLLGLTFLEGFHYEGNGIWENGRIYNPENGKVYKARISLTAGNRLLLRGYWGVSLLGRTETWMRCGSRAHSEA
jgi:uncharacterized protein (DUF2147 family)